MAKRVQHHFQWIDPEIVNNRIIWTGLNNYLQNHGIEKHRRFRPDQFQAFLKMIFDSQSTSPVFCKFYFQFLYFMFCILQYFFSFFCFL